MDNQLVGSDQIVSAIEALKKYLVKTRDKHQKDLLNPAEQENIHLQFGLKKISLKKKIIKILLPHSLVDETTSICLFAGDDDRSNRDYTVTIDNLREKLNRAGIQHRIEIVPLKQLKLEYKEYESKRGLLTLYDMFLADDRIVRLLPPQLGKHFYIRKRHPVQVDLTRKDEGLKKEVDKALCTTQCVITGRGSSGQVTVARMSQNVEDIVDNVVAAIQRLSTSLTGGKMNIRSLHLKVQDSPSLPIYISTGTKDDVVLQKTHRKNLPNVPEDVTTITDGKVLVTGRGDVKVLIDSVVDVDKTQKAKKKRNLSKQKEPKLVPIVTDDELLEPKAEIKEEIVTEDAAQKQTKPNKRGTKKVVSNENAAKSTDAVDVIKVEDNERENQGRRKNVTQKASKRFAVQSEPPKKKRKV